MKEQNITIRPLSPALCEDWLSYFDKIAFQDHEDWAFCYCLEGHLDRKTQEEWTDPKERREKAVELIRTGVMQGYLAYLGDTVIGWCNVNDRENYRYLTEMFREIGYQTEDAAGTRVKTIYCFLIAQSIVERVLHSVCWIGCAKMRHGRDMRILKFIPLQTKILNFSIMALTGCMSEADLPRLQT